MDLIFTKSGKFRNGINVLVVTEDHVKNKAVLPVVAENGVNYVAKGYAKVPEIIPDLTQEEIKKLKLPELKDYAEKKQIDLGDAEKKDDVLNVVIESLFPDLTQED